MMAKKQKVNRSTARLYAVQAVYQLLMSDDPNADRVVNEYLSHRLGKDLDGIELLEPDTALFKDITASAWHAKEQSEQLIVTHLKEGWDIARLELILHAIVLCGAYELAKRPDVPTAVVITEYVDITHAFCEKQEAAFINGLLDSCAKSVRS